MSGSRAQRLAARRATMVAASSDGVLSSVSNFHDTADEIAHDRQVLYALGGPPGTFTPSHAYDLAR